MIDELKVALANHIESSLIVWGYHWDVEGVDFNQYHSFFGEIKDLYYDQIDILAEYVRIISKAEEYVNASVDIVKVNKTVKAKIVVGSKPKEMVSEILVLNDALLADMENLFKLATSANEQGLANYAAGYMDELKKLNWKLLTVGK
jgi:DNA-binding ferritin-like protein